MQKLLLVFLPAAVGLLLMQLAAAAFAKSGIAPADTSFHPKIKPTLEVKRRTSEIVIDGNINDSGWSDATPVSGFTGSFPVYGYKPEDGTRAMMSYDDDNLYIAMIADDSTPSNIRATHCQRDNIWNDDFMGIILDTYGDGSRAFEIYVNPYGVQGDLFWTSTNEDQTYDIIYESAAKITDRGWQFEMKIPFRSLRFPDIPVQNFHCTFWRSQPRDQVYKSSWSAVNFFEPCAFCQFGKLIGIEHVHPAGSYELLPSLVASQEATSQSGQALAGSAIQFKPSLGMRYVLGTATGLEATLNPDFSQVESDVAQISANTTFALYYPEHRPFFQDGSDLYNMNINAIYTRSINSPIVAAKAIHRDDAFSIAYVGAVDEHSPDIIPLEERTVILPDQGRSVSNIVRATYSFGNDTKIGALITNRTFSDGSNSVTGLDGRIRLFENVELAGQSLLSYTQEPRTTRNGDTGYFDNGKHSIEYDGEHFYGFSNFLSLQRITNGPDISITYEGLSPNFRAANGFISQNDIHIIETFLGDKIPILSPGILHEFDMSILLDRNVNFDNVVKYISYKPEIDLSLAAQTTVHLNYRHTHERFHNVDFTNINFGTLSFNTHPYSWLDLNCSFTYGTNIARLDTPALGQESDITIQATFKPFDGFIVAPEYYFSRLDSMDGQGQFYSGAIYRTNLSYQFNREMNARLIVQYDSFTNALEVDPLFTYQVNPLTSIYLGSSHHYNSFDQTDRLVASDRVFFAKVQYLFRG